MGEAGSQMTPTVVFQHLRMLSANEPVPFLRADVEDLRSATKVSDMDVFLVWLMSVSVQFRIDGAFLSEIVQRRIIEEYARCIVVISLSCLFH
jgi:hypothetical protein